MHINFNVKKLKLSNFSRVSPILKIFINFAEIFLEKNHDKVQNKCMKTSIKHDQDKGAIS